MFSAQEARNALKNVSPSEKEVAAMEKKIMAAIANRQEKLLLYEELPRGMYELLEKSGYFVSRVSDHREGGVLITISWEEGK